MRKSLALTTFMICFILSLSACGHTARREKVETPAKPSATRTEPVRGPGMPPGSKFYSDQDFFWDTLFIGDSIFVGLSLFKHLPKDNVFAKVGIDAAAMQKLKLEGRDVLGASNRFKRAVVMLGVNAVRENTHRNVQHMINLVNLLKPKIEVVVLTITPVARENVYHLTKDMIDRYNEALLEAGLTAKFSVLDLCSDFKNEAGYIKKEYVYKDGLHLTNNAYHELLSFVRTQLETLKM